MDLDTAGTLLSASNLSLLVGAILVAVGTFGAIKANSAIQVHAEIRQLKTDVKIAEATEASSAADARAADANLKAAEANERAAKLENETSLLRKQAEEAKAETAKVNERLQKMQTLRRLTPDQTETLSSFLKSEQFKIGEGMTTFRVASVADSESQMYAMQFQNLFHSCGANVSPTPYGGVNACNQIDQDAGGLILSVKSLDITPEVLPYVHFFNLMNSMGLEVQVQLMPMQDDLAMLNILRKPKEI